MHLKNESIKPGRFVKTLKPNIQIPELLEEYLKRTLQPWIANYIIKTEKGEGNSNPLQYSSLENPMDGGAWRATVHWVTRSRTRLSD